MKTLFTMFFTLALLAIGGLAFLLSGKYNVAASRPHARATEWILSTATDRSIRSHAGKQSAPTLTDSASLKEGFHHFREMCITCHGAPGIPASEIGEGLNPEAPELSKVAKEWSPGELHWIIEQGIKMTGMPAFGKTHTQEELWGLVAFVRAISGLSPKEYRALAQKLGDDDGKKPDEEKPGVEEKVPAAIPPHTHHHHHHDS